MSAVARITHIKNPLTIIAMFAVIAEVSGTLVLPFMQATVQTIYVWYLMAFPILLCIGFFVFLWFKPVALYAPGDYLDENNFMRGIRPATYVEVRDKESEEAQSAEPAGDRSPQPDEAVSASRAEGQLAGDSANPQPGRPLESESSDRIFEDELDEAHIYRTKTGRKVVMSSRGSNSRRVREAVGLKRMEQIYGSLTAGVVIGGQVFDALAQKRQTPVVIEVVDCSGSLAVARDRAAKALERVREGTAALSLANNGSPVHGAIAIVGPLEAAEQVAKSISDFASQFSIYANIRIHEVGI